MHPPTESQPHGFAPRRVPSRRDAIKIALGYGVVGVLWILFSDVALHRLVPDPDLSALIGGLKGWMFVLIGAVILGIALDRFFKAIRDSVREAHGTESTRRSLFDAIPESVFIMDVNGVVLAANRTFAARVNSSPEDCVGKSAFGFVPPETASARGAMLQEVVRTGRAVEFEDVRHGRWMRHSLCPVVGQDGTVERVAVFAVDVTDRRRADEEIRSSQERLRASEERLRLMFENTGEAILAGRPDGTVVAANPAACRMFGCEEAELCRLGRAGLADLSDPRWKEGVKQRERSGAFRGELRFRRCSGEIFEAEISSTVFQGTGGEVQTSILIRDITERRRAEVFRQALLGLGTRLSHTRDAMGVGRALLEAADTLWAWESATMDLLEPNAGGVFPVLCVDVVDGKRVEVPPATTTELTPRIRRIMKEGPQLILRDPKQPPEADAVMFGDKERRSASIMAVPIHREGETVGILSIQSYAEHAYTPADLQTLQAIADYCGGALARIRSLEALRQTEERFRGLVETSLDWIWEIDASGRYSYASPRVKDLLGYLPEEVLGRTPFDLMPAPEAHRVAAIFKDIEARRAPLRGLENFNVHRDGHLVVLETSGVPIKGPNGEHAGYRGVDRDVTERKRAEAALTASEERFRTLVENAPIGIFLQAESRFVYVNREAARLFGHSDAANLVGQPVLHRIHEQGRARAVERIRLLNEERQPQAVAEHRCVRVDGSEFVGEFQAVPFLVDGKSGALVFFQDVTHRRSLEAQMRQAQKLEAIGQLAGGVAHDFNNILAAVMMHLGLLQMKRNLDDETVEALKDLSAEANRAASLTRQLLMFSRRSVLSVKAMDMNEVIANVLKMLSRLIGEHVRLRFDAGAGLPLVQADAGMLEQVLVNLVVNSRDAMPDGGRITLTTSAITLGPDDVAEGQERRTGRFVCVEVADTGCGMDAALLKRIFEPFFTTKEAGRGTGLGLATVHGIVAQHQGWTEVESEVGRGTAFRFLLPAMEAPPALPQAEEAPAPILGGTETILLVEDDPSLRVIAAQSLRRLGYRVFEAGNGKDAMSLWSTCGSEVDLVLTDMVMPEGMTGLELVDRLCSMKPGLRAIISSGYSSEMVQAGRPNRAGVHYLPKPYEMPTLAAAVRACLKPGK